MKTSRKDNKYFNQHNMQTHLNHLGLENFRVFKERTDFHFAPITILTGTNSSGKSSLISAMEMLSKINESSDIKSTLNRPSDLLADLMVGTVIKKGSEKFNAFEIDTSTINNLIGGFGNNLSHNSSTNLMRISKTISLTYIPFLATLELAYELDPNDRLRGQLCEIRIGIPKVSQDLFSIKRNGSDLDVKVNFGFFFETLDGLLTGTITTTIDESEEEFIDEEFEYENLIGNDLKEKLLDFFSSKKPYFKLIVHDDGNSSLADMEQVKLELKDRLLNSYKESGFKGDLEEYKLTQQKDVILKNYGRLSGNVITATALNLALRYCSIPLLGDVDSDLNNFYVKALSVSNVGAGFNNEHKDAVKFIFDNFITQNIYKALLQIKIDEFIKEAAHRVNVKRSFSTYQMDDFLRLIQTAQQILSKTGSFEAEGVRKYFKHSLQHLGIADEMKLVVGEDDSSVIVKLVKNGIESNLADVGYGYSQLLRILLNIVIIIHKYPQGLDSEERIEKFGMTENREKKWWSYMPQTNGFIYAIEEPEAHLHPALQSKLADLFVDAAKTFGIQFIIETHSEYLIRKLQYLTAKGEIKPTDTAIYYFYPPDKVPPGEQQVKRIDIDEDGYLSSDFGTGFFDESDKIAMSIWNLNKSNRN